MSEEAANAREMARNSEAAGDWKAALTFYNDLIYHSDTASERAQAYLAKARILTEIGEGAKAEQHLAQAVEHDPEIPAAWVRYVDCALERSEWVEASARAERAIPHAGTGPEGLWLLECLAVGRDPSPASLAAGLRARIPPSAS